jgi:hypothetical protein
MHHNTMPAAALLLAAVLGLAAGWTGLAQALIALIPDLKRQGWDECQEPLAHWLAPSTLRSSPVYNNPWLQVLSKERRILSCCEVLVSVKSSGTGGFWNYFLCLCLLLQCAHHQSFRPAALRHCLTLHSSRSAAGNCMF